MKPFCTLFFTVFASIFFLNGQDNSRSAAQWMMDGIIQHRKAMEACELQDFIVAHKFYDEAISSFDKAKKASEKDKNTRERAKQQLELIRKEKETCRPGYKKSFNLEQGARSLGVSGIIVEKSTGTGAIVGHIANMTVRNGSDQELTVCFSNKSACPVNSVHIGMMYIPNEKYQDYVVFGPLDFVIPPQSTFIIPVTGVCVQPDEDPVPDEIPFSSPDTWILESDPPLQFSLNGVRSNKSESGLTIANVKQVWHDVPVSDHGITIVSGKNRPLTAALVFNAIQKIDSTIAVLNGNGSLQKSMFEKKSMNSVSYIKLYSAWYYVGVLTGDPYTYDNFEKGVLAQIDPQITSDPNNKMSIVGEAGKFWDQVLVVVRASGILKGNFQSDLSIEQKAKPD